MGESFHEYGRPLSVVGRVRWIMRIGVGCPIGDVMFVAGITSLDCPRRDRCVRNDHGLYDACYRHALTDDAVDIVMER